MRRGAASRAARRRRRRDAVVAGRCRGSARRRRRAVSRRRSPSAGRPRSCRPSGRRRSPTSSPRYMTAIRSDISRTSSSSAETSRIGRAGVALRDRLAVDELDAADVEAARRLVEDEQLQVAVELAGDDDLLLVAARQRAGADARPTASGCRTPRCARSAAACDRRVVAQDPARDTAAGSSWSGRGCRRSRTAGPGRTGGGRPGRRRRRPR